MKFCCRLLDSSGRCFLAFLALIFAPGRCFFGEPSCAAAPATVLTQSAASAGPGVVINEIHFDPPDKTRPEEFIELHNASPFEVPLGGWRFASGITFTFPAATVIPPGGFAVVAANPAAFRASFGFLPLGPWTGNLQNDGEKILLVDPEARLIDEVDYGVGFPWPTASHGLGASHELLHPDLDNNLGGSWRAARRIMELTAAQRFINPLDRNWRFHKGTNAPSGGNAWRQLNYAEDASWQTGATSIGYGDGDDQTLLEDMMNSYTTVYLRHKFSVRAGQVPAFLQLNLNVDDGAVAWINGTEVARFNVSVTEPAFNSTASGAIEAAWQRFIITNTTMLVTGENVLAIHALNQSTNSSDLTIDAELRTPDADFLEGRPTPGATNSVALTSFSDAPPLIRQVNHQPRQPTNGQVVTVTAKVTDIDRVAEVFLSYQVVNPGQYIRKADPAYQTSWTDIPMRDDGTNGDAVSGDSIFSVQLPGSLQTHRRLVRYRITARDARNNSIRVPYADDDSPNFAWFTYNGAPTWRGASRPGSTPVLEFPSSLMNSLPIYHLLANPTDVSNSQWNGGYDAVRMWGTLVYDGEVYDHIQFHNRGEASTYVAGKNKWRFHFNRARDFQARDLWGRRYRADWKTLNFDACASPWASVNRGMAGLDEAVAYRLYDLAGVPSSKTHYVHFRVIDQAAEASATSQYEGDLWGLYQAIEQPDGRFLKERDLPEGNVYKIEGGGGDKKNQGPTQSSDASDWNTFMARSLGSQTEAWWRLNMDMPKFYSFHAMNRVSANIDLRHGANHYAYHAPDGRWVILPWDLDMMFIPETHWPGIIDQNRALSLPALALEFKNRCREILDLICSDGSREGGQVGQLIDEFAAIVNPPGLPLTWADLDECMWNWHPQTTGSNVPSGQTNHRGNFYRTPFSDFRMGGSWVRTLASANLEGFVKYITDFCTDTDPDGFAPGDGDQRGYGYNYLEAEALDPAIPQTPTISYTGPENFPANVLRFESSAFNDPQGPGTFAAMQWRLGEIANPALPNYAPGSPRKYEIEPLWDSGELTNFSSQMTFPPTIARPGSTYRARVRHKDNTGRWSHWSAPLQFLASAGKGTLAASLVISEVMYHPPGPSAVEAALGYTANDFEFIELQNIGDATLDLTGLSLTKGADFEFPPGATLAPGAYALIVREATAFGLRYGAKLPVLGTYGPDKLDDAGERIELSYQGAPILSFAYNDAAPWPVAADGEGYSLVLKAPQINPNPTDPFNWRASVEPGGTPGSTDASSFADWKRFHGITSDTEDSDHDGLTAFMEYATGGDPSVSSAANVPAFRASTVPGSLEVLIHRQASADEARHLIAISTNLVKWTPLIISPFARMLAGAVETLHYSVPIPNGPGSLFLQVKFERR